MPDSRHRKLTERQVAVFAAVERLGRAVMADLWDEFPELAPSAIKKVLDALERKGLVDRAGDDSQVFVNGVHWWSIAVGPTERSAELEALANTIDGAQLGLRRSVDPHDQSVTVFLPLVELEAYLGGLPSDPMQRLRRCVERLEEAGYALRVTVSTQMSNAPEPVLAVQLRPMVSSAEVTA